MIIIIECRNAIKGFCESIKLTHPRFVLEKLIVFYTIIGGVR